ncbi:tyrosine-type recombinase/integrase [Polaribacter sp. HL-MS24]|uniref:tyrosine-type recombinase/integrase n=1 Tax=Polaribacter sp. HL-MS24 TaxID=3077735 RepID=UPI0029351A56|nr:tyrosine-type recombinase/integrase [Polaribacter sp. HL-MS24]WOC41057.1 tyrosine-type recombinase/integrase [Polaribacter sp. HL-MS24]
MKIDIRFRKQKKHSIKEPVYLRLNHSHNGKQKRIWFKTDYSLKSGENIEKALSKDIRYNLQSCIEFIEDDFYNRINFEPSTKWLSATANSFFNSNKKNGYLLNDEMTDFIEKQIKLGRAFNTIKDNRQSQNIIKSFRDNIELADCTFKLFDEFTDFLKFEKDFGVSNLNRKIRFLKTILKEAKRKYPNEVPDDFRDLEPLRETKAEKNKKEGVYKVTFTNEELTAINNLNLKKDSLINARKWLIIGVNTAVRGSDLLNLTLNEFDIENKLLKKQQQKTKSFAYIPILPPVQEILKDFPHKISLQKFDKYLKEICELAEMTNLVISTKSVKTTNGWRVKVVEDKKYTFCSSHMFRRSFITNYFGKLPNQEIMKVSGHKSEREFLGYVQEVKMNHKIWFDMYEKEKEN